MTTFSTSECDTYRRPRSTQGPATSQVECIGQYIAGSIAALVSNLRKHSLLRIEHSSSPVSGSLNPLHRDILRIEGRRHL